MSTLHDLRATLEQHAGALDDTERYIRPVAVRARIRAVRRRRAGLASAVAALAIVASVATVDGLRSPTTPEPAGTTLLGIHLPQHIEVLGFPYELSEDPATFEEAVTLRGDGMDLAVTLAGSDLGSGSVTLLSDGEPVARVRGDEHLSVPVPLGQQESHLAFRFDGTPGGARAGVAVYHSFGELAPGVSRGNAVFRDSVAGKHLLAARFAKPGSSGVTFSFTGAPSDLYYAGLCSGDDSLWLNVSVDGDGAMAGGCQTPAAGPVEPGTGWSNPDASTTVGTHTVHAWLTRGDKGPVVDPSDATYGVGVYGGAETRHVLDADVDVTVEHGGRTWRLVEEITDATSNVEVSTMDGEDRLIGLTSRDDLPVRATWRGRLLSKRSSSSIGGGGGTLPGVGVLLAGDTYRVSLIREDAAGRPDAAILVYRPE